MSDIHTAKNDERTQQQLREMKGARLFRNGNVLMTDEAFYVQSETHPDTVYEVQGTTCECHDYMKRKKACKHQYAIEFYILTNDFLANGMGMGN